ncbi:MAG: hypothetical protein WKF81_11360 [Thermomicrobiales bacterium]
MAVSQISDRRIRESLTEYQSSESSTFVLERRLIEGERRIASAESRGEDTTRLVDFWIELLHQYEQSVDAFPRAA